MFFLRRPPDSLLAELLDEVREAPYTYSEAGSTRFSTAPDGYPQNHHRARIGLGAGAFARAEAALRSWRMYELPWTNTFPAVVPIEEGAVVGTLARHLGLWSFNPCRIVYTFDEREPVRRLGFAFGTLPAHSESGEERFTIEMHADGAVWYEILSYARPHHPLAHVAPPIVRYYQRRFGRESLVAMARAVEQPPAA